MNLGRFVPSRWQLGVFIMPGFHPNLPYLQSLCSWTIQYHLVSMTGILPQSLLGELSAPELQQCLGWPLCSSVIWEPFVLYNAVFPLFVSCFIPKIFAITSFKSWKITEPNCRWPITFYVYFLPTIFASKMILWTVLETIQVL